LNVSIAPQHTACCNAGSFRIEIKTYVDRIDPESGRRVFQSVNGGSSIRTHGIRKMANQSEKRILPRESMKDSGLNG
jgi:hypothetical protein